MCVEDGSGESFKVAVNSAVEFGILYNPNNNVGEALVSHKSIGEVCVCRSRGECCALDYF